MKFIGVSGKAGTGKDFIVRNLIAPYFTNGKSYVIISFADHFKTEAIVREGLDRSKVYGRKDKHTRSRLQLIGTEEGRNVLNNDNLWVNILNERLIQYEERGIEYVFITDCRFTNEIEYIHSKGGKVIRINAEDRHLEAMEKENGNDKFITSHISENIEFKNWDYVLNNSKNNLRNIVQNTIDVCEDIEKFYRYKKVVFCDFDGVSLNELKHTHLLPYTKDMYMVIVSSYPISDNLIKLFHCGLSHLKIEHSCDKTSSRFNELIKKYPSENYYIITPTLSIANELSVSGIKFINVFNHPIQV